MPPLPDHVFALAYERAVESVQPSTSPFSYVSGWEPAPLKSAHPPGLTSKQIALREMIAYEVKRNLMRRPFKASPPPDLSRPDGFSVHSGMVPGVASLRAP